MGDWANSEGAVSLDEVAEALDDLFEMFDYSQLKSNASRQTVQVLHKRYCGSSDPDRVRVLVNRFGTSHCTGVRAHCSFTDVKIYFVISLF